MTDDFDLDRFIRAQEPVMTQVRQELAAGRKRSHWMWFVFPQLAGLGHSAMARRYAISCWGTAPWPAGTPSHHWLRRRPTWSTQFSAHGWSNLRNWSIR